MLSVVDDDTSNNNSNSDSNNNENASNQFGIMQSMIRELLLDIRRIYSNRIECLSMKVVGCCVYFVVCCVLSCSLFSLRELSLMSFHDFTTKRLKLLHFNLALRFMTDEQENYC